MNMYWISPRRDVKPSPAIMFFFSVVVFYFHHLLVSVSTQFSTNETFAPRSQELIIAQMPAWHFVRQAQTQRHKQNKTKQNFIFKTGRGRKTSLCLLLGEARVAFTHLKVLLCILNSSSSLRISPTLFPLLLNLYYDFPGLLDVLFSLPSCKKTPNKTVGLFFMCLAIDFN